MSEITTEHLPNLKDIQLKYKSNKYPVCKDPNLPKMYFVALFIASRGSGKTYSACQLLKAYEKFGLYHANHEIDQRIILISPTSAANPCYTALKNLHEDDIHGHYSDNLLLDIVEDIKTEKKNTDDYMRRMKVWNKFLKMKRLQDLTNEDLIELEHMHYEEPQKPKYPNFCCNFLILDDLIGSSAFKSTGKSAFTELCLKNRHLGINILVMTQNLKAIPKSIRTNTSCFIIYRFASIKVITNDLWEEVSNTISLENFEKLFDYATSGEHNSLIIDFSQPKENRFKQNWDTILRIKS